MAVKISAYPCLCSSMSCLGFSTASRALKTFHPKYHSSKLVARHNIQLTCYSTSTTGMQYLKHNPPRSAPRQVPTPLVFLSSSSLDKLSTAGYVSVRSPLSRSHSVGRWLSQDAPIRDQVRAKRLHMPRNRLTAGYTGQ